MIDMIGKEEARNAILPESRKFLTGVALVILLSLVLPFIPPLRDGLLFVDFTLNGEFGSRLCARVVQ